MKYITKNKRRLLSLILAFALVMNSYLPVFASGLCDITQIKGGQGGTASITENTIYFGNYWQESSKDAGKSGVQWRVLSNDNGKVFLLSDKALYADSFDAGWTETWANSSSRVTLNEWKGENISFAGDAFTEDEWNSIALTEHGDNGVTSYEKLFFLSDAEAQTSAYGFTTDKASSDTRVAKATAFAQHVKVYGNTSVTEIEYGNTYWWLRSPGYNSFTARYVVTKGGVSSTRVFEDLYGVRPALNLNQESILFLSAAVGGKGNVKVGDGFALDNTYAGANGWKLTLRVTSINTPTIGALTLDATGVSRLGYSGATVGDKMYVSAVLKNSNGNYVNYAKLATATATSGTGTVDKGTVTDGTYDMLIFGEQEKGNYLTDYAGNFASAIPVTFKDGVITAMTLGKDYTADSNDVTLANGFALTLDGDATYNQDFTISTGTGNNKLIAGTDGTTIAGTVTVNADSEVTLENPFTLSDAVSMAGTMNVAGNTNVSGGINSSSNTAGTINVASDKTLTLSGANADKITTLNNKGTVAINKTNTENTVTIGSLTDDTGTLGIKNGTVNITGTVKQKKITNDGTLTILGSYLFTAEGLTNNGTLTSTAGKVVANVINNGTFNRAGLIYGTINTSAEATEKGTLNLTGATIVGAAVKNQKITASNIMHANKPDTAGGSNLDSSDDLTLASTATLNTRTINSVVAQQINNITVGNFKAEGNSVWNLDMTAVKEGSTVVLKADSITTNTDPNTGKSVATGKLKLGTIRFNTSIDEVQTTTTPYEVQVIKHSGSNLETDLEIEGTSFVYGNFTFDVSQKTDNTDPTNIKKYGTLQVTVNSFNGSLADIVRANPDGLGTMPSFALANDIADTLVTDDKVGDDDKGIGTLKRSTSASDARSFTIYGNGHKITATTDYASRNPNGLGIATATGNTGDSVELVDVTMKGFGKGDNAYALNIASGTYGKLNNVTFAKKDGETDDTTYSGYDVINDGTLTLYENASTFNKGITGNGDTIISTDLDITASTNAKIHQKTIQIDADYMLTSLASQIVVATNGVTDNGTLVLKGVMTGDTTTGLLGSVIKGNGNVKIGDSSTTGQTVSSDAAKFASTLNSLEVTDKNTLTLTGTDSTLSHAITGDGNVTISGTVSSDASNFAISDTGKLTVADAQLTLTGTGTTGVLTHSIAASGTATTVIDGDVTATDTSAKINTATMVNASKKLTAKADNIGGNVTNNGTVELTTGELKKAISGGKTIIAEDVTATDTEAKLNTATTINSGTDTNPTTLTADADNIGDVVEVKMNGKVVFTSGELNYTVSNYDDENPGTTEVNGIVTTSAKISTLIKINSGEDKKLTASANDIGGTVTNDGTLELKGGTLDQLVKASAADNGYGKIDLKRATKIANQINNQEITLSGNSDDYSTVGNTDYISGKGNQLTFNGGGFDFIDGKTTANTFDAINLTSDGHLKLDVDLLNQKMDTISASNVNITGTAKLHITALTLLTDTWRDTTVIPFTSNDKLKAATIYDNDGEALHVASHTRQYIAKYNNNTGKFTFTMVGASDTTKAISDSAVAMSLAFLQIVNNMQKRLGDLRGGEESDMAWARFQRNNDDLDGTSKTNLSGNLYQVGYDFALKNDKFARSFFGLSLERFDGSQSYLNGGGDAKSTSLGAYYTKIYDSGHYFDFIFRYGRLESDTRNYDNIAGIATNLDYAMNSVTLSGEYGYRANLGKAGLYFEPQAEFIYGYLSGAQATSSTNYLADIDSTNHFVTRVGLAFGQKLNNFNYYIRGSYYHDFAGTTNITYGGTPYKQDGAQNWWEVSLGGGWYLSKVSYFYAEFTKHFKDISNSLNFNLGFRLTL